MIQEAMNCLTQFQLVIMKQFGPTLLRGYNNYVISIVGYEMDIKMAQGRSNCRHSSGLRDPHGGDVGDTYICETLGSLRII